MKTILVVEDDETMRKTLRIMLEKTNFCVLEASNGLEAEDVYKKESPSLVLMDIVLPGEHGLDAIKGIIAFDTDARIIAHSGLHQESLVMAALNAGARDFLAKPFELEEIIAAIKKHVK